MFHDFTIVDRSYFEIEEDHLWVLFNMKAVLVSFK